MRCRFAPSPTGALHVGTARTALLAWLQARAGGGTFLLRTEDIDRPRVVAGAAQRTLDDLHWLGLDWDEGPDVGGPVGPYDQSARTSVYEEALRKLEASADVFRCTCSRAEVARAASAPHGPQDDGPRYPGTCRRGVAAPGRRHAFRFRVPETPVELADGFAGAQSFDVQGSVGDFVVCRADGVFAYQLAVAVDDAHMGVTHVLRGDDLLSSTPRQLLILGALGLPAPRYFHIPLVLGPGADRLQKRTPDITLAGLRERGVAPERLVGHLAALSGLVAPGTECHPRDLVSVFRLDRIPRTPVRFDAAAVAVGALP